MLNYKNLQENMDLYRNLFKNGKPFKHVEITNFLLLNNLGGAVTGVPRVYLGDLQTL